MAFHLPFTPTTIFSLFILLSFFTKPSHSALNCASQKLNRTYANCKDLPFLGATLHFTYAADNRTLSVAFSAAPPSHSGWVAWALNLAGGGMIGAEALIAFPDTGAAVAVHRYNLTAYKGIDEVKAFSFDSWDLSAEQSDGVTTIFAKVKIPEKANNVSHVWQVGPVSGSKPVMHATKPENLQSRAVLPVALGPATASGDNATAPASGGEKKNGATKKSVVGFYFGMVLALMVGSVAL